MRQRESNIRSNVRVGAYEDLFSRPKDLMNDDRKSKTELIRELEGLRRQLLELEALEAKQRKMEQELVHIQRLRTTAELAAGVSHNLNNVLTGIMAPAQLLKMRTDDEEILKDLEIIFASAARARDLVKYLQHVVRGNGSEITEPVSVVEVVKEAVEAAKPRWKDEAEAKGISIQVVLKLEDTPKIKGTQSGLHEILLNLLFNAVEAIPERGEITIETWCVGQDIQLTIQDTGVGMDDEVKSRAFDAFFSTREGRGTGLGLFMVKETVTRWGGRVALETRPGGGSTFRLRFPVWKDSEREGGEALRKESARSGSILIVEDDENVCRVLTKIISSGHKVETITDSRDAIERFGPGLYDVALIDLGMPGVPGDSVATEMKRIEPDLITILITGWRLDESDSRLENFDLYLQKPFDGIEAVGDVIARGIELRDRRSGPRTGPNEDSDS